MARGKSTGTKSQAVSEYLSANKDASPNQIVEALKARAHALRERIQAVTHRP